MEPVRTRTRGADATPDTLTRTLAAWASGLGVRAIPERVREYATSQLVSQVATIRASLRHPLGMRVRQAFGPAHPADPKALAYLLAGLSTCLYQEDSMYGGHVSHASVNVPLSYVYAERLDGPALLTAIVAANECAARVTSAATLGPFRGQAASCVQLVGAVAGRLRAASAPAAEWVDAWGLALGAPPWTLQRGFGSDAKVLSSAIPVRTALDCCDAARAGIRGAPDILEHPHGFLARFATVGLPAAVTAGLGTRWHTDTLTFKIHPAGAYVDAAIDCAIALHARLRSGDAYRIQEVVVRVPRLTIEMDALAGQYLAADRSSIVALNLSVGYNVATALLTGAVTPADLAPPNTADPERWRLAERVRLVYDRVLGRNLLLGTAPFGEALRDAGGRARGWLADFAGIDIDELLPAGSAASTTFSDATKATGARVTMRLSDGTELVAGVPSPRGAAGPDTRREHRAIVRDKALAAGLSPADVDLLRQVPALDHDGVRRVLDATLFEGLHDA